MVSSHATSIKYLETYLKMLSAQLSIQAKSNDQLYMVITTRSGKVLEFSMETKTPFFGKSKECERENETTMNLGNTTLCNLESECSDKDGGQSKEAKEESTEKEASPSKPFTRVDPIPQRLEKRDDKAKFQKFISIFNSLTSNIPLVEALTKITIYGRFMKELVIKKRALEYEMIEVSHNYSAILTRHVIARRDDPGAFIKSCTIGTCEFGKALCNLGAII